MATIFKHLYPLLRSFIQGWRSLAVGVSEFSVKYFTGKIQFWLSKGAFICTSTYFTGENTRVQ